MRVAFAGRILTMVKIITGTMGSVLVSAKTLRTAMFRDARMAPKKALAFRTLFSHENTAHGVLALMLYKEAQCVQRGKHAANTSVAASSPKALVLVTASLLPYYVV